MYPSNYNPQTRTCQFIEEFNGAASFRMWPLKNKIHIEVYTPDMKRRKEKEVSCHVASANEYVRKMYATFKNYEPKETTKALYIDSVHGYVKVPDGEYSQRSEGVVFDRFTFLPEIPFENFVSEKMLDHLKYVNKSIIEAVGGFFSCHSNPIGQEVEKGEPISSANAMDEINKLHNKINPIVSRGKDLTLAFEKAVSQEINRVARINPSDYSVMPNVSDYLEKASSLRYKFENAMIYHHCKVNSLDMSEIEVISTDNRDGFTRQTFINGMFVYVISEMPYCEPLNFSSVLRPLEPYGFVTECIYPRSEFDNIISEYDKFVNTPSYEELLEAISKKPPSHLPIPDFTNVENIEPSENDFFSGNWLFDY